jgi:hypothetical protein
MQFVTDLSRERAGRSTELITGLLLEAPRRKMLPSSRACREPQLSP